jgi:hypothetical protein
MKQITLHQPTPQLQLPAHEQAARDHRAAILGLPAPAQPTPPPTPTPGRKTVQLGYPDARSAAYTVAHYQHHIR